MKKCKQWLVSFFDERDIEYVQGVGCAYEAHDSIEATEIVEPITGNRYKIVEKWRGHGLYIITDNDEHEAMILLKYTGDITLMRVWWQNEWEHYEFS